MPLTLTPLFSRPTANVDMHAVEMDDVVRIVPKWGVTASGSPVVEVYDVETVPQGAPVGAQGRISQLSRVDANPQRLLFLDGKPVTTVSVRYVPLQNKTFFDSVEQIVRRSYPDVGAAYYEGASEWQRLGTYQVEAEVEIPFDPASSPDKFDFYIMVTNSMDTTYSINVVGVWRLGALRLTSNSRVFHHARTGEGQRKLVDDVLGYLGRVILDHKLPTRTYARLKAEPLEERHVIEVANKMYLTKKEAAVLERWGFKLERVEGEYVGVVRIPGAPTTARTGWDALVMFSEAAGAATSTWREWEACKKVSQAVAQVVLG